MNERRPDVRPFHESDVPSVLRLWTECEGLGHGPGDDPPALARFLDRNPGLSFVAEEGGTIAGAVLCGHDGRRGFMYRLAVAPSFRRRGIARALARAGLAALAAEGIPRCMVFVLADNRAALDFWASLGALPRNEMRILSLDLGPAGD
jgi:ribosomal protein S18 acetylase RimI-like enzyme